MELAKRRGDVIETFNRRKYNTGKGILNTLKSSKRRMGKTEEKRITVVKSGGDKGICESDGRVVVEEVSDLAKLSYVKKGSLADGRDVFLV